MSSPPGKITYIGKMPPRARKAKSTKQRATVAAPESPAPVPSPALPPARPSSSTAATVQTTSPVPAAPPVPTLKEEHTIVAPRRRNYGFLHASPGAPVAPPPAHALVAPALAIVAPSPTPAPASQRSTPTQVFPLSTATPVAPPAAALPAASPVFPPSAPLSIPLTIGQISAPAPPLTPVPIAQGGRPPVAPSPAPEDDPDIMEIDAPEVTARRAVTRARTAFLHMVPVKPEPVESQVAPEQSVDEPEQSRAIGDSEDDGRMPRTPDDTPVHRDWPRSERRILAALDWIRDVQDSLDYLWDTTLHLAEELDMLLEENRGRV